MENEQEVREYNLEQMLEHSRPHWSRFNLDSSNGDFNISAKDLWNVACTYFKWVDTHPIVTKEKVKLGKEAGKEILVEYKRPYELSALCLHCSISDDYLKELLDMPGVNDYKRVAQAIKYTIKSQLLEYGLIDVFNSTLVTKILGVGIADETDVSNNKSVKVELISQDIPKLSTSESDFSEFDLIQNEIKEKSTEHSDRISLG